MLDALSLTCIQFLFYDLDYLLQVLLVPASATEISFITKCSQHVRFRWKRHVRTPHRMLLISRSMAEEHGSAGNHCRMDFKFALLDFEIAYCRFLRYPWSK